VNDRDLRKLREGMKDYFRAYYAEVRRLIETHDAHDEVPAPYQGCKRVLAMLGADGLVITHWEAPEDSFEFETSTESAEEIIARQTGNLSGGPDLGRHPPEIGRGCEVISTGDGYGLSILPHTAGRDFGAVTIQEPVRVPRMDGTMWVTGWTRLDAASVDHLYVWTDALQARTEARDHLSRYLG
jgi:hypothetical protein